MNVAVSVDVVEGPYGAVLYCTPYIFSRRRWLRARHAYTRAIRELPGSRWPRWDALDPFTKAQIAHDVGGLHPSPTPSRTDP